MLNRRFTPFLYLSVIDQAMSSVLVQETGKAHRPVYIVSKEFKGAETRYQKIERLALEAVINVRKLIHYVHGRRVMLKTTYPNRLEKPILARNTCFGHAHYHI